MPKVGLLVAVALVFFACDNEETTSQKEFESAADQLAEEYSQFGDGQVDPAAVGRVLELSESFIKDVRAAGVEKFKEALKKELTRRGLKSIDIDGLQDFTLGEPLPGVPEYFESTDTIASTKQAIGTEEFDTIEQQFWDCPPIEQKGDDSCHEIVDSALKMVKPEPGEIAGEVEAMTSNDDVLNSQPPSFNDFSESYLSRLGEAVQQFGIDVAAIRAEYILRNEEVCDQELKDLDGAEIARLRGIEESIHIIRKIIGQEEPLAPTGGECIVIGQTGKRVDEIIEKEITRIVTETQLCADMSRTNPNVQDAEKFRLEGIRQGIVSHTTTIWVGSMRVDKNTGSISNDKRIQYTVAKVDGCQPKDRVKITTSPLVIDLAGDGLELTTKRVHFDLLATGQPQKVTWTGAAEGLLALDLNGDGRVTSGRELFGNHSNCQGKECADGAEALAVHDSNADGRIDAKDAVFDKLQIWVDANQDGRSQADELQSLSDHGIEALKLQPAYFSEHVPAGRISLTLDVETKNGPRKAYDVWFKNLVSPGFPTPLQ